MIADLQGDGLLRCVLFCSDDPADRCCSMRSHHPPTVTRPGRYICTSTAAVLFVCPGCITQSSPVPRPVRCVSQHCWCIVYLSRFPRPQAGEVRLQLRCQTIQWNEQQPMYPSRLCRCVSQLERRRPTAALLYNCHVHTRCTVSHYTE